MDERTGVRWKQKPFYSIGNSERHLEGTDIVPMTHAPSVEGEEADGKVSMDALAEMVHTNISCLGATQDVCQSDTVILRSGGNAVLTDVGSLMCAEVPEIRPSHASIECAEIQRLKAACPIEGDLSGTASMAEMDTCGRSIPGTYVKCSDAPVSCVMVSSSDGGIDISVSYVGGSRASFTADTKAVIEAQSLPEKIESKVYNVGKKVYSKGVELTTREDFDARPMDIVKSADGCVYVCAADVVSVHGSSVVSGDLTVSGNIYQSGCAFTTHAEDLDVGSSTITVRAGAESAMADGEMAGIVVRKYNGEDDMSIMVGLDGVARLGKPSSLQPFLLRDEEANLADGCPLVWSAAGKMAVQGELPPSDSIVNQGGAAYVCVLSDCRVVADAPGGAQMLSGCTKFLAGDSGIYIGQSSSFVCLSDSNGINGDGIYLNSGSGGVDAWPYINVKKGCRLSTCCGLICCSGGAFLYSDGIGFRRSAGDGSGWVRLTEDDSGCGDLEIAVGGSGCCVAFRRYDACNNIRLSTCVPAVSGSLVVVESFDSSTGTLCLRG